MTTVRRNGQLPAPRPTQGRFTGGAAQHPLLEGSEPTGVRVSIVSFEPGSRTFWHRHQGGQVLHVVDGQGATQTDGGPVEVIGPGDIVSVGPGERHWHGATAAAGMRHLAVTLGEVTWLEEPPPL